MPLQVLLPTTYLAPISYYSTLIKTNAVTIDKHENFVKQTIRNRCSIYGANGVLNLTIPILHKGIRQLTSEVKIAYSEKWQKLHWKSLQTAYRSSPYFEFYEDELKSFYINEEHELLYDFNTHLFNHILSLISIKLNMDFTHSYIQTPTTLLNLRDNDVNIEEYPEYLQVFQDRHGFIPNLSILDLVFNLGPSAGEYLKQLVIKHS